MLLYLCRLDGLFVHQVRGGIEKVRTLGGAAIVYEFDALFVKLGYPAQTPSFSENDLSTVIHKGPEYVFACIAQKLIVVTKIGEKGGGPSSAGCAVAR